VVTSQAKDTKMKATVKQLQYFQKLVASRDISAMVKTMPDNWLLVMTELTEQINHRGVEYVHSSGYYARRDLSTLIGELLKCPSNPLNQVVYDYVHDTAGGGNNPVYVPNDIAKLANTPKDDIPDGDIDKVYPGEVPPVALPHVPHQHLANLPSPYPPSPFGSTDSMDAAQKWAEASKITTPRPDAFRSKSIEQSFHPRTDLQDGMYKGPRPNEHIYKVYHTVHGANQQVAKRLMVAGGEPGIASGPSQQRSTTVKFKYEGKAPLKFLKPSMRLSLAEAATFGKLYGVCCICGAILTNELSIALGIGPVCGNREFNGDFEFMVNQVKLRLGMLVQNPVSKAADIGDWDHYDPEAAAHDYSEGPPI
jgi:hypothetical protein